MPEGIVRVLVVGGSAAGLFTCLLLARDGHEVVVLDRDPLDPAPHVEAAAESAFRAAAPQIVQPHVVLSLCRELLLERLPALYAGLIAAGVAEAPLSSQMPPSLPDRGAWPGDERMALLMTRRSTLDWVLRRAAATQPGVTLRGSTPVTGLLATPGRPPHVTGVRTADGEDLTADLVIDATGRRSTIDRWLTAIDGRPTATFAAECGLAYYSRHYRLRTRTGLPGLPTTRIVAGLDEFTIGIWGEDSDTMVVLIAPMAEDKRFRGVHDPEVFTAVVRTVPVHAAWLEVLEPITPVYPMGGLHNTLRRMVVDGSPVATGLHTIGDTVCTTNPTLGRGLSLALRQAVDLADAIDRYDDPRDLAIALDRAVEDHVAPYYADQAGIDATRLAQLRHTISGAPAPAPPPTTGRVTYAQLRNAAPYDPTVFRAFWKVMGMVSLPETIYTDPAIVARTNEVIRTHGAGPPIAQPTRDQLLRALGTA